MYTYKYITGIDREFDLIKLETKWKALQNTTVDPHCRALCRVAIDILTCPPGIGQLESTFNGLKLIHNIFRNKLGTECLAMILYCWWNCKKLRNIKKRAMSRTYSSKNSNNSNNSNQHNIIINPNNNMNNNNNQNSNYNNAANNNNRNMGNNRMGNNNNYMNNGGDGNNAMLH